MLAFGLLAVVMFGCVVGLGTDPQIPMLVGCVIAGLIALYLGFDWEEILDAMQKGINDSMEACLILICIGIMVAVWILSGTVPTMIYYGLEVVTPQLFLPVCFLATLVIGIIVGSWGAAGTIGLAFIGIAAALGVPLGMAAGAIIAAAYVSEIVSPLVDGPNLAAAIADVDVFALCKRFLPLVIIVCLACAGIYAVIGFGLDVSGDVESSTSAILAGLKDAYNIGPVTLIPLVVMVACVAFQVPAIPSFLVGIALGAVEAVFYQGIDPSVLIDSMVAGAESDTGAQLIDTLLSAGGINEMLETISIILLVMAYAGIMQHCGLMVSMVEPIINRLKSFASLAGATVFSPGCVVQRAAPRPVSGDHHVHAGLSRRIQSPRCRPRRMGQHRELVGRHHLGARAVEHVLHLHGHHLGRRLRRLHGIRVLLLSVPDRGLYRGRVLREETGLGSQRRARTRADRAEGRSVIPSRLGEAPKLLAPSQV